MEGITSTEYKFNAFSKLWSRLFLLGIKKVQHTYYFSVLSGYINSGHKNAVIKMSVLSPVQSPQDQNRSRE